MKLPLQVTFRRMEHSDTLEQAIREHVEELEQFYSDIMSCRVMVEPHSQHHRQGNIYHVRIDLTLPGKELVVSREADQNHAHEDVYVAVRDAFNAMRRQLEDVARKQRGKVKAHEAVPHGRISQLVPDQGYGWITSADGREFYFHQNSLLNIDFEDLELGSEVRFAEEMGEEGLQASSVSIVGKHHVVERME